MENSDFLHNIILEERKKMNISGVKDVISFEEEAIALITTKGKLLIKGENLHIIQFDTKSGDLTAEGKVFAIGYISEEKQGGIFSKIFK